MEHFEYTEKKITIDVNFNEDDFATMHDAIIDATQKHLNQDELIEVWNLLPIGIKIPAIEFGVSDSTFRDDLYEWAENNIDKFEKYTTWN